jgi:hypothetical protein
MSLDFNVTKCQTHSDKKIFGLCDDPPPAVSPAYIDEVNGGKWIAVVENEDRYSATFTAIDNCIEIRRAGGTMEKRCDGVLTYNSTVIFVELKVRGASRNAWVIDAEKQLRATISNFETTEAAEVYSSKKAYIANSEHPKFKESQARRMDQFLTDTGYVLRIINRIVLQ